MRPERKALLTNKAGAEFVTHNAGSTLRISRKRRPAADMIRGRQDTQWAMKNANETIDSIRQFFTSDDDEKANDMFYRQSNIMHLLPL
jgi:hypothetical protein